MLQRGEVDAALIPSIEFQRMDEVLIVPHISVAVDGPVRSVLLISEKPTEEVNSVALDLSSRTGATLTRIYFRHFLQRDVEFREHPPNLEEMLEAADAALLIGDPALLANYRNSSYRITDWGQLWKELTGLPFVFALWAVRCESVSVLAEIDFTMIKREGTDSCGRIIDEAVNRLQLPYQYLEEYLNRCITYDLDHIHLRGLSRFYELAATLGLVDSLKPLEFWRRPQQ